MQLLGGLSKEEFLAEYWQKKPLLIRQAWPNFTPLLSAQELAGLSLEQDIESRILIEQQALPNFKKSLSEQPEQEPWVLKKGPFDEQTYQNLPQTHWTLLIQALDHWLPEARHIMDKFNFIPNWRVDDLMVSYAVNGGSVGAHYDQYDVFLLQAQGQRQWSIGQMCDENSEIIEGLPVKLLREFNETQSWVLEPGDMLYLPPALAHYGIAQGECMTYSIGFRAPSYSELAQSLLDEVIISNNDAKRYQDERFSELDKPGKLTKDALAPIKTMLKNLINDDALLASSLGLLMSEAKYPELTVEPLENKEVAERLKQLNNQPEGICYKDEQTRFAYYVQNQSVDFFIQGQKYSHSLKMLEIIEYLANHNQYDNTKLLELMRQHQGEQLVADLIKKHHLYLP